MTYFEVACPHASQPPTLHAPHWWFSVSPPRVAFGGEGAPGAISKVGEASRQGHARVVHLVNDRVLTVVTVVAAYVVAYPVIFLKIPIAGCRRCLREKLDLEMAVRTTYLLSAIVSLFCAVVVTSAPIFTIV